VAHCRSVDDDKNEASPKPMLLKVEAVCVMLSLSRSSVYALMRSGELKSTLIGPNQRRIPATAVEAYVAGLTASTPRRAAS
jgi:excisionase family DNA binding protein